MNDTEASAGGRPTRAGWLTIAILVVVTATPAWIFRDLIRGRRVVYTLDTLTYVEPRSAEVLRAVEQHRFPLWSPCIAGGVPFFAEMDNGVLNPFNLLLAFGARRWMDFAGPLWCMLAGIFLYLLLREWDCSELASGLGAVAFGAGGFLVSYVDNPPYLNASCCLPLVLLLWHRALARRSTVYLCLTAVALAIMLSPGEAQTVYDTVVLTLLYGFVVPGVRRPWLDVPLAYAALGGVTFLLTAVQLLPTVELLSQAPRVLTIEAALEWSLHPGRLLELVMPFAYGTGLPGSPYWGDFLHGARDPGPWTRLIYVGVAPLVLLPAALRSPRRALAWLLASVAGVATLASLGQTLPLYTWIYQYVPLMNRFRVPSKLWILVVFCLAVLAALGLDAARERGRSRSGLAIAALLTAAGLTATLLELRPAMRASLGVAGAHLAMASFLLLLGLALLARAPRVACVIIAVVHLADVVRVDMRYADFFGPPSVAPATPVGAAAAILRDARGRSPLRIHHDPDLVAAEGFEAPRGLSQPEARKLWDRLSLDWNHAMLWNIQDIGGYTVLQDGRPLRLRAFLQDFPEATMPLLGRLAVDYLVLARATPPPPGTTLISQRGAPIQIVRVDAPAPRAFLARKAIALSDPDVVLQTLADRRFDPREHVLLESGTDAVPFPGVDSAAPLGEVSLKHYEAGLLVIEVETAEPRYLVVGEAPYAGWRVHVDGAPRAAIRANYLMQAIPIRPGEKQVVLRYLPQSFVTGAIVSGASWAGLIAYLVWAWRRRTEEAAP